MVSALLAGCAAGRDIELADPRGTTISNGKLTFATDGTITLAPGEAREVTVIASPPLEVDVRFALIGDTLDASLDRSVATADADGEATVLLRAPHQATTFRLRATMLDEHGQPGPSADTGVAVSDQGFGTVRVLPAYSGKRLVNGWIASVIARTTCQDIAPALPAMPDGALTATGPSGQPVLVKGAPVGPNLAVAVRSSKYMWGCADVADLKPDATLDVKVTIVDKPIDLAATNLLLNLEYSPDPVGYEALLDGGGTLLGEAFAPTGAKEPTLLLDGMAAAANDAIAFEAERAAASWDATAQLHWVALGTTLRERIALWAKAGLLQVPHALTASLKAMAGQPGTAAFSVTKLAGINADAAGIPKAIPFAWTADPSDSLLLTGTLYWQPSGFVGAAATMGAKQDFPSAPAMPEALAAAVDCAGLGALLGGYNSCDGACMAALCQSALGARWKKAIGASLAAGKMGHISITAAGPAEITDTAEPIGFYGNWLGSVSVGALSATAKGKISGQVPVGAPP